MNCTICNNKKDLTEFELRKDSGTYRKQCKQCRNNKSKKHYEENKETYTKRHKEYYDSNKDDILRKGKEYYNNNLDKEKLRH
jgi:hypothetical protein